VSIQRIGVVGAGIVGLAVARRLAQVLPGVGVTVWDKEAEVGRHQSSHNSGVVHAGLYYAPGTLKAQLCARGRHLMREYCEEHGLPYQEVGKAVIAATPEEVGALGDIEARATAAGVPGLRRLTPGDLAEVEPHAVGIMGLHSPHTAIADFHAVTRALAEEVVGAGGDVRLAQMVTRIEARGSGVAVRTAAGEDVVDRLVLCPGLQSDRVARLAGGPAEPAIVPFRGEYLRLRPERRHLVRGLIYPVPDPRYPFLGVHFTTRVDGAVDVGPNAVLAMSREGYDRSTRSFADLRATLGTRGFPHLARAHWRAGVRELAGSRSRRVFVERARRYVPELAVADVEPGGAGVRAQAVDRDGSLVDDFRIQRLGAVLAVRNAPSPAATSSLAIAEHLSTELLVDSA
jgi:L-2-hydroxyglutarate oxidase LhgO